MSTLRVNNITDTSGGSSSLSVPGAAKAWVNFNGTGVVAIRAQLNVSSITDNGTGDYTMNLTTAMVDANATASCAIGDNSQTLAMRSWVSSSTQARIVTSNAGQSASVDPTFAQLAIFR